MITQKQLSAALHQPVYDSGGRKIGEARTVFCDDVTGRPDWVTVKTGMLGASESFVPIHNAVLTEGHLKVPYSKSKIKSAPSVSVDAQGHLSAREEHRLYDFYGVDWRAAEQRRPDGRQQAGEQGRDREAYGRASAAEAAAAAPQTTAQRVTAESATTGQAAAGQTAERASARQGAGQATAGQTTAEQDAARQAMADRAAAERAPGAPGGRFATSQDAVGAETADGAMTRSEERMHVGVERHETGRARLRKYVVTEEQEQTVPLRHEEVRLVREPITEANRGEALSGPEIAEAEHVVTLHEETPVVETTVEPVERVRLAVDERTEQRSVRGRVRKEQIKLENTGEDTEST